MCKTKFKFSPRENHERRHHKERRPVLDKTPVVGKIYSGKVTSIRNFGCFIQLEGLAEKVEGLCHISELRQSGLNAKYAFILIDIRLFRRNSLKVFVDG